MASYIYDQESGELYHYGVLGMKWGVRRYQNEDGSLTPRGKRRFDRVANSERAQRRNTKVAISALKSDKNETDLDAWGFNLSANRRYKKMDKLVWKSEARQQLGDQTGFQKYQNKAWKQYAKYMKERQLYEQRIQKSAALQKKIDDISNGTLKAGRDFVSRKSSWVIPIPGYGFIAGTNADYIEKNGN